MGKHCYNLIILLLLSQFVLFSSPIEELLTNNEANYYFKDIEKQLLLKANHRDSISDSTAPTVTRPNDINYLVNSTGNTLNWYIADKNPGIYSVQHNYQYIGIQQNISWTENKSIIISIDNLPIGIHLYTIIVEDSWGNEISDDVLVTVKGNIFEPVFDYTTTDPYNLAEITRNLFIVGINIAVLIFVSLVIITGNRYRRRRRLFSNLPPRDPLELENHVEEDII